MFHADKRMFLKETCYLPFHRTLVIILEQWTLHMIVPSRDGYEPNFDS